jgi:hypothetical protein
MTAPPYCITWTLSTCSPPASSSTSSVTSPVSTTPSESTVAGYSPTGPVYFDTPDLRTFHDHVAGRRRDSSCARGAYLDSHDCQCEVKVKTTDDKTDKRQADHPSDAGDQIGPRRAALERRGVERRRGRADPRPAAGPRHRVPALQPSRHEAVACALPPTSIFGSTASTTARKRARAAAGWCSRPRARTIDRALRDAGVDRVSMSKYRVGIELLVQPDSTGETAGLRGLFSLEPSSASA